MTDESKAVEGLILSTAPSEAALEDVGQVVHLCNRAGEELYAGDKPVTITVAGTYSKVYRRTRYAVYQRVHKKNRGKDLSVEQSDAAAIEVVAACILGWDGIMGKPGEPLPFNRENAVQLLTQLPWVREQVEAAQQDHEGFSRSSSGS